MPTLPAHRTRPLRGPAALLKPTAESAVEIVPHARWNDANGNQTIHDKEEMLRELQDVKSIFATDENICFALFVLGLKDTRLRFDLWDVRHGVLTSSEVPVAEDGVFAFRQVAAEQLPGAGMYFFQWYLNDQPLHYTPIQVTRPLSEAGFVFKTPLDVKNSAPRRRGPVER